MQIILYIEVVPTKASSLDLFFIRTKINRKKDVCVMRKKVIGIMFFVIFSSYALQAIQKDMNASGNVQAECSDYMCDVDLGITDQSARDIANDVRSLTMEKRIERLTIHSTSQTFTVEDWKNLGNELRFSEIPFLDLQWVILPEDTLPANFFAYESDDQELQNIILPDVQTISANAFQGVKSIRSITLPKRLTTIETDALLDKLKPSYSYEEKTITVTNDMTPYYQELVKSKANALTLNINEQSQLGTLPYLENFALTKLDTNCTNSNPINLDLEQLFGNSLTKNMLTDFSNGCTLSSFNATNFPGIYDPSFDSRMTSYILKNAKLSSTPRNITALPSGITFDISGNQIDYTKPNNAAFYTANKDTYHLNGQKPNLKIVKMNDIIAAVNAPIPTITPSFQYANEATINFSDPCPEWMDSAYYNSYSTNVTYGQPYHQYE